MASGRMLKKTISYSEKLAKLKTVDACLLYTWTLAHLDVNGNFYGNPDLIKGVVVPVRKEYTAKSISECIDDMELQGLIIRYTDNGGTYLNYPDFRDKQIRLDKNESSQFPQFHKDKIISPTVSVGNPTESDGIRQPIKIKIQKQIPEQAIVQKICKKIKHNEIELNEIEKEILDCWNKIPGVIICKILTDKRRSLLKQRLEDRFFSDNWKEAMRKVFHSPFLRGQTEKGEEHGNWKPDFDWFIRPDGKKTASVVLIMEGKYDQKEKVREAD